jgi:hypothetical protein
MILTEEPHSDHALFRAKHRANHGQAFFEKFTITKADNQNQFLMGQHSWTLGVSTKGLKVTGPPEEA